MFRKITSFCMAICILFTLSVPAIAAEPALSVSIDGEMIAFTESSGAPFADENSRTLVPLRAAMEAYGCQVYWDNENNRAVVYKDGVTVVCPVYQSYIEVNGVRTEIDTAAVAKNGRIYLPIRAVLEAMGADVDWDGASRTVVVERHETDVLLHQDAYVARAEAAIDANSSLNAKNKARIKEATALFLQNIAVDEAQISKMCARLQRMTYREATLRGEKAGECSTSDSIRYTVTLDLSKLNDDDHAMRTLFHELCHMFSDISSSKNGTLTTEAWFCEGMTCCLEQDIVGNASGFNYDLSFDYDIYFRACRILCELLGSDIMLEAYLTGNTDLIYAPLNEYSGRHDAGSVLSSNIQKMSNAMDGGVFTWLDQSRGKTEEEWEAIYSECYAAREELFAAAYEGKYGRAIDTDPILATYLSWLSIFNFSNTAMILAAPASSNSEYISYFGRLHYRSFALLRDKNCRFCSDKELIVYRY